MTGRWPKIHSPKGRCLRKPAAKSDADKKRIQRAIAATDRKIDALVYELYGLTDEEISIVEGGR